MVRSTITVMTIIDTSGQLLSSVSALALAGLSAFAVAIRWAMTHTHSQRLLALEQKAADHDTDIAKAIAKVDAVAPLIIAQAGPVITAIDPKVDAQIAAHKAQIDELQKVIAEATGKLNDITKAMPKTGLVQKIS